MAAICTPAYAGTQTIDVTDIGVEDGDTVIVDIDDTSERLQLVHIDASEDLVNAKLQHDMKRTGLDSESLLKLGAAATGHLRSLTTDQGPFIVTYDPDVRDRYGRISADISGTTGPSLSTSMLSDGYAKVLNPRQPGATQPPIQLKALEADAISSERGIWGSDPVTARAWHGGISQ